MRWSKPTPARTLGAMIAKGELPDRRYGYGDQRPLREEIIEEFESRGQTDAVLSRNAYGSLVLNTASVFFADIDLPQARTSLFGKLFGGKAHDPTAAIVERIQAVVASNGVGVRVYRTAAGFRCLGRSLPMLPESGESQQLLQSLGSDPLYVRLCASQKCFRARLTPKPWRIGCRNPPDRFPFRSSQSEREFRDWVIEYDRRRLGFTVCCRWVILGLRPLTPSSSRSCGCTISMPAAKANRWPDVGSRSTGYL